jgi:hypothetical protein
MMTSVHRNLDQWSDSYLRSNALAGGIDARHQFLNRNFELRAYYARTKVDGTPAAIALTQQSLVHNYQRPDDNVAFDSTRTSVSGYSAQINLAKRGGGSTLFSTGIQLLSPGFETNDVGFLSRANSKNQFFWAQYHQNTPRAFYRFWNFNVNQWTKYAWDGTRTDVGGNINTHWQLKNSWWLHFGEGVNGAAASYCDNCTRGGPAIRSDRSTWGWAGFEGDPRMTIVPYLFGNWGTGDGGRSRNWNAGPTFDFRMTTRLTASVSYNYGRSVNATQFNGNYGQIGADTTHYTVARLDQTTRSMTVRLGVTATPNLSLQIYAAPFATHGNFSDWLQIAKARAEQWTDRYRTFDGGDPGAFDFKQYRSNTVLRWEYRPGSTLYVVWAQERTQGLNGGDARTAEAGFSGLKRAHPANVFLVKGSYWLSY